MNHEAYQLMLAALKRQYANIQRWLETGEPAGAEESREITEQIRDAIEAAERAEPEPTREQLAEALRELHDFAVTDSHYRYGDRSLNAFQKAAALLEKMGR